MPHSARLFSSVIRQTLGFAAAGTLLLVGLCPGVAQGQSVVAPGETVASYTQEWTGDRFEDGRPRVPADLLERMENVTLEQAWGVLQQHGYEEQVPGFGGSWKRIHPDQPIVGRVLTAQYTPSRPDVESPLETNGQQQHGFEGPSNTWPIQMLRQGDVYVADGYGKIEGGTLIGDRLGTDIYSNSGNGVIFNGSLRDLSGLEEIEGFNAFVRDWHPSIIENMMLAGINVPIRIGDATVVPGDVVLATREGAIFIPAHLAREVVRDAELTILTDMFAKQRTKEGIYTSSQLDTEWTDTIKQDFYEWLENNKSDLPIPANRIEEIIETEPL